MVQRRVNAVLQKNASIRMEKETVHLDFYAYTTPDSQQHWDVSAVLPPDAREGAIVVGGGGWAQGHETSAGAFLTCSCPTRDLDGWVVASKDHIVADPHQLSLYLLALRIDGMRRPDLLRFVQIFEAQSAPEEHPTVRVSVPEGYTVLSGGFWVDWRGEGNLATASVPDGNGWTAKSKSHIKASPATIHAYAIGIKKILPGALSVVQHINHAESNRAAHPTVDVKLDPGLLLTGAGAQVNWNGWGNMLTRIQPSVTSEPVKPVEQGVAASAKDHNESDPSTVTVYAVGARLPDTAFDIDNRFNADNLARYVQTLTGAGV
jgi:hypothetical protein